MSKNELLSTIEETARFFADYEEHRVYNLNFTEESLISIDDMVEDFYGDESPSKENINSMIWAYGSYVAMVINNHYHGKWYRNTESAEIIFELETSGVGLKPYNWVAKKFEKNESIKPKYDSITNMIKGDRK